MPARRSRADHAARTARRARADHAARWLCADVGMAVRFEPVAGCGGAAAAPAADLRVGLRRWRRRIARRRTVVLGRRLLLVGAAVVFATEVALTLAGADHRSPWLVAPAALVALAGTILASRRVTLEQTAHMLDRGLGLHDRVGTALELAGGARRAPAAPRRAPGAAGLERRIAAEADAALRQSFGGARLTVPRARTEWAALLAAALALALLIALPGAHRHHNPAPSTAAAAGASRGASAPHRAGAPRRAGPPRLATPPTNASLPSGAERHYGGAPTSRSVRRVATEQLRRNGLAVPRRAVSARRRRRGGPQGVSVAVRARGHGSHSALAGVFEAVPTGSGAGSAGTAVGVEVPGGSVGLSPVTSAVSPTGGGRHHAPAAPRSGGARSGGPTGSPHGGGSPGGDRPGAQSGRTALGPALVPNLPQGTAGLPVAAGYAPSLTGRAPRPGGVSQIPNGGAGSGRSAHADGAPGVSSTSFEVLAPFSDAAPALDEPALNDYFGVANQLGPGGW
jgi:hypothetical protein